MLDRLTAAIDRHCVGPGSDTAIPRLSLVAVDEPTEPTGQLYEPMICFVADGAKRTTAGDLSEVAHAGEMLLTTIDLPVTAALEKVPYRSAVMRLDDQALADLIIELDETGPAAPPSATGQVKAPMAPELLDAITRWVELLDAPADIRPLAPRIEAEIHYRLLRSPFGTVLRQGALADSTTSRMRQVTRWICERYDQPLSIDAIAAVAHMSPASLHRHFKATTGMSPLKYQKHLRLQEARRRLATGDGVRRELLAVLDELAAREGVDRGTVALAFVLAHPSGPVAILGTQTPQRLRDAQRALEVHLDRVDCYRIVEASEGVPHP